MTDHVRERILARYRAATPVEPEGPAKPAELTVTPERAFVTDQRGTDGKLRTIVTAPLREIAQVNQGFMYLRGRFVEADTPNRNGALWSSSDLEAGHRTVAGGPLNWLHQERKIIGALTSGDLQPARAAAADAPAVGPHISSDAVLWKFLYPGEARAVASAADNGNLFYSMECLSKTVACAQEYGGCGAEVSYEDFDAGRACAHLVQRTHARRFVDPYFLGGAVIVPPVNPGWANANVEVMREAAEEVERTGFGDGLVDTDEARAMVAQLIGWAAR